MIMTYDFILLAQRDAELMQAIHDAMASQESKTVYTDIHKLTFCPAKQTVTVHSLSITSPFHHKIVPKEIAYSAVVKMLDNNWEDISKEEIIDIE